MLQCREIVDDFLQCGKDIDYDVVHLLSALDLKDGDTDIYHGKMTALIRYKTPYTMSGKGSFVLSFALINDVSLPSVLGLTYFSDMCCYRFRFQLLPCVELNRKFTLELYPLDKC